MDTPTISTPRTPRRVLCLEDEQFISELYVRALVKAGYEVKTCPDGTEGFEEAKTNTYDIILLDLMMPNMLGMDILKRLRTEVPQLKAKVIVTTNLGQSKEHREAMEKQADGYLIKAEVTPRQLVEFLNKIG